MCPCFSSGVIFFIAGMLDVLGAHPISCIIWCIGFSCIASICILCSLPSCIAQPTNPIDAAIAANPLVNIFVSADHLLSMSCPFIS